MIRRPPRSAVAALATWFVALAAVLAWGSLAIPAFPAWAHHTKASAAAKNEDKPSGSKASSGHRAPLFDGMGKHTHAITTNDPLAQRYFDQGLVLVYGFNHDEAIRSFEEAARIDPQCAMAYWGIALAYGPHINLPMESPRERAAYQAIEHAKELSADASAPEQAYIRALSVRYSERGDGNRQKLNEAYVDSMRVLAHALPDDMDAQVLFAEALMNLRPWDHWTPDGKPQPGTEELLDVLERVMVRNPDHPGANHYYIHAVEASLEPQRAEAAAERLPKLVPGAGHLVHMPAHVWMRTGRYNDASKANWQAATVDEKYIAKENPQGAYPMIYYTHNVHFLWASLAMEGRSKDSIQASRKAASLISADMVRAMPMAEFIPPTPYFALARFGLWNEVLAEPEPPMDLRYTRGMWFYARGMALANLRRVDEAGEPLDSLHAIRDSIPADLVVGLNSAKALLGVASAVLNAEMTSKSGGAMEAIDATWSEAIAQEETLKYDEPPPWYQPVRQLYGAWLLDQGRPAEAERVYREDLKRLPENGWSLHGLALALGAQQPGTKQAKAEFANINERFKKAWGKADVKPPSSRF